MLLKESTVLCMLEKATMLHPDKTALKCEAEELTFRELEVRSNQLAHYLGKGEVLHDVPICFCLEQSVEKIVVMLSIWKAGGAYVSLDPSYPEARLRHILDDTNSPILITTKAFSEKFEFYKGNVLYVDELYAVLNQMSVKTPDLIAGSALAYLAYTSGSTGFPKAVMAHHKGLENFVRFFGTFLNADEEDTAVNISSSNFDGIVLDLWVPLSLGLTVYLYPDNRIVGAPLLEYIRKNRISILPYLPVSILATLPPDESAGVLRKICTGGEAPIPEVVENWKKKVELINIYGPTETTVVVSGFKFNDSHPITTIGKPLSNVDFYVLNEAMESVKKGETGELYIGGIQVSRGYYNQPELTAEKFKVVHLQGGKKDRIYKTGDLVRVLSDDTFEFMGRADQQVKIRGFRVEPSEIEETMRKSGLIENCVVLVKERHNEKYLVCFYKNIQGKNTFAGDIRSYLIQHLPSYMIPEKFLELDVFPLTANGKINKNVLRDKEIKEEKRKDGVLPQTELQRKLGILWCEILNTETVSIHDNFFYYGGNSVLAYRFVSKINKELDIPLRTAALFLHPTIEELAVYCNEIQSVCDEEEPYITDKENIELSRQQQSLWFIDRLHGSTAYNVGALYPVKEGVSVAVLEKAIRMLLKKHSVLRSVIKESSSFITSETMSEGNWMMENLYSSDNLHDLLKIPFDLERDYMVRAYLINEGNHPKSLFLIIHHIVTDGWSMGLITEEINQLYLRLLNEDEVKSEMPDLQSYTDYAYWQSKQKNEEGIRFWKSFLEDVPVLQLPYDRKKQQLKSGSAKQFRFMIDQELTAELKKMSESQSVTLYTTLISAFGLLMQYYSGQSDICIGSPAANRPHYFEKTIGYFANMMPVRLKIEGNPVFSSLLKQNMKVLSEVLQHQYVPLESIISHVMNDRFAGHNPLFQCVFTLQDPIEAAAEHYPVNSGRVEWVFNEKSKFDLHFEANPEGAELKFNIDYSDELFDEYTISEMAATFQSILKEVVSNPQVKAGDIKVWNVLNRNEEFLSEDKELPKTFIVLFEEQVKRTPDKTALIFSGMGISYQELYQKSAQVATHLRAFGITNGDFVACYQDQSLERVITLLGIMMAGAAYVPLDVTYPPERVQTILNDTNARIMVTSVRTIVKQNRYEVQTLFIEELLSDPVENIRESFAGTHLPSDLAYVIHTSGTTGLPKGVLIEHQALGNFITEYGRLIGLNEQDRTLQFSPYNFDGSIIDLWIPLIKGATVHMYPNNKLLGTHLAEFLSLNSITVIPFISPSVLSTIPECSEFPMLNVIGTGGETCPSTLSNRWKHKVKLLNMYGPTEATVAVNKFIFDDVHPGNTIGVPIRNMRLYVLDQYGRPVPKGGTGELYISGIQLSRGYLNQPELTSRQFLSNPFTGDKEGIYGKLYKTGDQVKVLPNGMLEYIGRNDHQVKIRGYRIELAEIENGLCLIKGITNAVVSVHIYSENVKAIRAFVTGILDTSFIKTELNKKLPAYMIPNEVYVVDEIPLTSSGKANLTALGLIAENYDRSEKIKKEKPANRHERIIKEIWKEVLQRDIDCMEDDFFHLGGHSLLLTKLYNKLYERFPNTLSLSELYLNSSIRKLALLIRKREANPEENSYALGMDPLSDEIRKDATIEPGRFKFGNLQKGNFENPDVVFLTGVTGFVGANMLVELLQGAASVVYLLIRAEDEKQAQERLRNALSDQFIQLTDEQYKRIRLLPGDLSKPYLGLLPSMYDALTKTVDVVYHAGSSVNFIQPYSYMKAANVDALHTLIKFVTTVKLKQLSLLSTVGVFSWEHYFTKPSLIKEDTDIKTAFKYLSRDMGYIQSKWVMEQVAQEAVKQGVPIVIFRLGYVFCHSLTGATARYQWWGSLIKTCVELKCYPILVDQKEELTMVDFVSKAIVYISRKQDAVGKIFHLSPEPKDNITVMEFFELLHKEFGFDLRPVPYDEWMRLWENDEKSPLYPLLNLFKFKAYDGKAIIEIHQNTPDFDISNTKKMLKGSNIENTTVNRKSVEAFCRYLGILE